VSTYDGNRCLMDNAYTYDAVDNVTKVTNTAPIPSTGIGGNITHNYAYDGLYRLQTANGFYQGNAGKIANYNLVMAYDNLHNITGKKLDIGQVNLQFTGELETGYDLTYAYNSTNDQQLTQVADTGYRWLGNPTPLTGQLHRYSYDASGNLTQVLTTRTEPIPRSLPQAPTATREVMLTNRRLLWDEENRLTAVSDNGYVSTYLYDASGERTVKLTGDGEGMTVNGRLSGGRTSTDGFTAYVNPYVVISNGSRLSKHIYAGSQRIVSKLCASGSSPSNPLILAKAAEGVVNYTAKYTALKASVAARYDSLGLPFLGADHAGSGFWTPTPTTRETDQYFYHPDHLGSSSLITTLGGVLAQHLEYLPFGEVLVDERATPTTRSTPYKFNAKELDEETGLYYYSARYLDPRLSLWLSVDPLAEKYPGVSSYVYCYNNPVKFVDPDGREGWSVTRQWGRSDVDGYAAYAKNKIQEYKDQKVKDDCANFAVRLIVGYASENELPLTLTNASGKIFDASSDKYTNATQYLNDARAGIQAQDIPLNTYGINQSETQAGDMEIIQYDIHRGKEVDFQHVVIFEKIDPTNVNKSDVVWGNDPPSELSGSSVNWPRYSPKNPDQEKWSVLSGNQNSRWKVLKPE
jgi:RHS repeat-associated protein